MLDAAVCSCGTVSAEASIVYMYSGNLHLSHHSAQPDPATHKLRTWPYLTLNSVWSVRLTWAVAGGPWFKIKSKWVKLIHICLCGPQQWHMLNETFKMHLVTRLLVLKPMKAIINCQVLENLIQVFWSMTAGLFISIYLWPYRSGFFIPIPCRNDI